MRRDSKIYLAFSWEIIFRQFTQDMTAAPSIGHFLSAQNMQSAMQDSILHLFHAVGMALSYVTYDLRMIRIGSTFEDPCNTRFDFYEQEGQAMLWKWCGMDKADGLKDRHLHIDEVMAYLRTHDSTSVFRKIKLVGNGLVKWRQSGRHETRSQVVVTLSKSNAPPEVTVSSWIA